MQWYPRLGTGGSRNENVTSGLCKEFYDKTVEEEKSLQLCINVESEVVRNIERMGSIENTESTERTENTEDIEMLGA